MTTNSLIKTCSWLGVYAGSLVLSAGIFYCFYNNSGHSSVSPLRSSLLFVPLLIFAVLHIIFTKGKELSAWALAIVAASGTGFGPFIHYTGIIQQYNYWAKQGMSAQTDYRNILLLLYILAIVGAFVYLSRRFKH